jgi:hypothetical protein
MTVSTNYNRQDQCRRKINSMRKLTILALVAMLAVGGSAFAQGAGRFDAEANATFTNGLNPTTTNNDDSCDIGVTPAATLLLPVFDVTTTSRADNTTFTITNVSRAPQIAHVTLWTDWSFPVLDFNIFLTGYDVQSISLYDVIVTGIVAPGGPGTSSTNATRSPRPTTGVSGAIPLANTANPNIPDANVSATSNCGGTNLPGDLPDELVLAVREALTTGIYNPGVAGVGCGDVPVGSNNGANARGYVTIDVANACSVNLPDNPTYISTELLFDNVLIGDYQQIDGDLVTGNFAQGNPMVHIRAIPEGGPAGSNPGTNLPYTFYDRYTTGLVGLPRTFDRRQPLPSTFAARWIEGGTGAFNTEFKIWREGLSFGTQSCAEADDNADMEVAQIVRFDERENSFGFGGQTVCSPCGPGEGPTLPEASITSTADGTFPDNTGTDIGGWMYLNLNNGGSAGYSENGGNFAPAGSDTITRASQNWAIVSMFAQGRYGVDFDAAWLGNGCSAAALNPATEIGPAGGVFVCPPNTVCVAGAGDEPYDGTNTTP